MEKLPTQTDLLKVGMLSLELSCPPAMWTLASNLKLWFPYIWTKGVEIFPRHDSQLALQNDDDGGGCYIPSV